VIATLFQDRSPQRQGLLEDLLADMFVDRRLGDDIDPTTETMAGRFPLLRMGV
jgi:hypothetical protein